MTPDLTIAIPGASFDDWNALYDLLSVCFAPMEGRIDPPSSFTAMTADTLRHKAQEETLITAHIGHRLVGCAFAVPHPPALYLGKLAVAPDQQRRGILRAMLARAEDLAATLSLSALELQTRVELTENHATFAALGFHEKSRSAHAGFDRPTSLTMWKALAPRPA